MRIIVVVDILPAFKRHHSLLLLLKVIAKFLFVLKLFCLCTYPLNKLCTEDQIVFYLKYQVVFQRHTLTGRFTETLVTFSLKKVSYK